MNTKTKGGKAASVSFRGVTKIYGNDVVAVDNVDLEVSPGKLVTLLGPSGCGKTTTLRMIAGLEMASSGQILIDNQDVTRLPATDRDVSMVFQSYALFPHMTVFENVCYGLKFSGFQKSEMNGRASAGLELVGLSDLGDRLPSELSGGQQQRVAVARALVLEPQVLLFDEPLSNLDAKLRRQVREEIRDIQQSLQLTVVYVTHDQEEALAVSDEIVVMRNAQIAQIGSPRELYDLPANTFVADFIGEANLLPCEIIEIVDDRARVELGHHVLLLPSRGLTPGNSTLAIRPNRIQFGSKQKQNSVKGAIKKATYVGSHLEYTVSTEYGSLFAVSLDVENVLEPDSEIFLNLEESSPVLVPDA